MHASYLSKHSRAFQGLEGGKIILNSLLPHTDYLTTFRVLCILFVSKVVVIAVVYQMAGEKFRQIVDVRSHNRMGPTWPKGESKRGFQK